MAAVSKSISIIKSLQTKEGGILASLPNDAYPYVYARDTVIMSLALNLVGEWRRSVRCYEFLKKVQRESGEIMHRYSGMLPYVTRKGQTDCTGLFLHGIWHTYLAGAGEAFLKEMWPAVLKAVSFLQTRLEHGLIRSHTSIHEFWRLEDGYEIWSNSACCRGLYSAAKIAAELKKKQAKKFLAFAEALKARIKKELFDPKLSVFIKTLRPDFSKIIAADASQLAPFYFALFDSKILRSTLNFLKKRIWDKRLSGFKRFKKFEVCKDWHWYTGGDGPWVSFTCWAARLYSELGEYEKARECKGWVDSLQTKEGWLPEHIATLAEYKAWKKNEIEFSHRIVNGMRRAESIKPPIEGVVYWTTPLGFSHAEYVFLELGINPFKESSCS